ncbi:hypothetical protein [Clostridium peptidivorans]|uniref:hypothetical protein n=1 Tax=Clostridium peptidivorans TaxID=100174 RepID=UPI001FA84342|nr:hypothetical protein [Clostridium peptidivorans]
MKKRQRFKNKFKITKAVIIAAVFEVILIGTAIANLVIKQWKDVFLCILAMVVLTAPFIIKYIASKNNIVLPKSFELVAVVFIILAQYCGEILNFYNFWWWDLFLHGVAGCYLFIIGICIYKSINIPKKQINKKVVILVDIIFSFGFSIAIGVLWEIFEATGDYLFKTHMTENGLEDTAGDLLIKTVTALITSIIYYFYKRKDNVKL